MAGFDFNTPNMMGSAGGMGNPFDSGLLAMLAANNPQMVASMAAQAGVPPPQPGTNPVNGIDFNQSPVGAFLTPSAGDPSSMAAVGGAGVPGAAGPAGANPWAMMQGIKGPQATPPIMSGGVSGAQKAPDPSNTALGTANSQMMALIQSLISQGQPQASAVPNVGSLGSILGGR